MFRRDGRVNPRYETRVGIASQGCRSLFLDRILRRLDGIGRHRPRAKGQTKAMIIRGEVRGGKVESLPRCRLWSPKRSNHPNPSVASRYACAKGSPD
jgi:hypothetical protein